MVYTMLGDAHVASPADLFAGADDITKRESLESRLAWACLVTSNALSNLRLLLVYYLDDLRCSVLLSNSTHVL